MGWGTRSAAVLAFSAKPNQITLIGYVSHPPVPHPRQYEIRKYRTNSLAAWHGMASAWQRHGMAAVAIRGTRTSTRSIQYRYE